MHKFFWKNKEAKSGYIFACLPVKNNSNYSPLEARMIITSQAQCLLAVGNYTLAQTVADQVLQQSPTFTEALLVKAEAFYNSCQFEHALLIFHRGARLSADSEGFSNGIAKCKKTLQNIVGHSDMFSFSGLTIFMRKVKSKTEKDPEFLDKFLAGRETIPPLSFQGSSSRWTTAASGELGNKQGDRGKKPGKKETSMAADKKYLQNLTKIMEKEKSSRGVAGRISNQANQALDFINGRSSFWDQIQT